MPPPPTTTAAAADQASTRGDLRKQHLQEVNHVPFALITSPLPFNLPSPSPSSQKAAAEESKTRRRRRRRGNIVLLPTPSSAHVGPYRQLFRRLHADGGFCTQAFGPSFGTLEWGSDDEVREFLAGRDGRLRWGTTRGMGDWAVGVLYHLPRGDGEGNGEEGEGEGDDGEGDDSKSDESEDLFERARGRLLKGPFTGWGGETDDGDGDGDDDGMKVKVVEGEEFEKLFAFSFPSSSSSSSSAEEEGNGGNISISSSTRSALLEEKVQWLGYTCVRDATTSSVAELYNDEEKKKKNVLLPPWQEMIEVRYGLGPEARGQGLGTRTAGIVMRWAVEEHGARRFIAETEKANAASAKLLKRLGFRESGTEYFGGDDAVVEWERPV